MYILDTDHLSLLQRPASTEAQRLRPRLKSLNPGERAVTIISFEEQVRGWMAQLAGAKLLEQQGYAYGRLEQLLKDYSESKVLSFDDQAIKKFLELKAARIRIGTMDLKIAAIALTNGATVLSRNVPDFSRVPGLNVEDWSKS